MDERVIVKNKEYIELKKYIINKGDISKVCYRCGKIFVNVKGHLRKKKECEAKYLNVERNLLLNNYDKYKNRFKNLFIGEKYCTICNKYFKYSTSLYRHKKKYCHKKIIENKEDTEIDRESEIKIEQKFILNDFDKEEELSLEIIIKIINNCLSNCFTKITKDIVEIYVKCKWIDIKNNRNTHIKDLRRKKIIIYEENIWKERNLDNIINIIRIKVIEYFNELIDDIEKDTKENEWDEDFIEIRYKKIETLRNYFKEIREKSSKIKKTNRNIINVFINNKDITKKSHINNK